MYKKFRIAKLSEMTVPMGKTQTFNFVNDELYSLHDKAVDALDQMSDDGGFIIMGCYYKENSH